MRTLLLALLLIAPGAHAADVYRCVTENGVVRYSDKPCEDGKADKLAIENRPTDPSNVESQAEARRNRLADIDKAEQEAAKAEKEAAGAAEKRARQCTQARERLQKLLAARKVTVTEDGQTKYLESEEIVQRRQEAQDKVNEYCGK